MKSRCLLVLLLAAALALATASAASAPKTGEVSPVAYTSGDGTKLTGYLSLPPGYQEGQKYPAILLIHGGKGTEQWRPRNQAESFLQAKPVKEHLLKKYVVFSAAYHSRYFGDRQEFESMAAALTTLSRLPQVEPGRIAALGVSHGGYLALMCAVHPDIGSRPRCAVSVSGVVDVATFVAHLSRWRLKGPEDLGEEFYPYATSQVAQALGWPPHLNARIKERYARISVLTYVQNLQIPVLVIHGTGDNLVPLSQARRLRDALVKHHKTFAYLEVPTAKIGGHFIFVTRLAVWDKIDTFLEQHL